MKEINATIYYSRKTALFQSQRRHFVAIGMQKWLLFTGRHFWNRKCRKKTWWQQEFAVFKCEATANSVTGHVCVYNNESVTVYETLDGKGLKNGTPHSRYFSDELGVPIILIDTEQMFALQRDAWYNINVNIVYYLRKKNYFRR